METNRKVNDYGETSDYSGETNQEVNYVIILSAPADKSNDNRKLVSEKIHHVESINSQPGENNRWK